MGCGKVLLASLMLVGSVISQNDRWVNFHADKVTGHGYKIELVTMTLAGGYTANDNWVCEVWAERSDPELGRFEMTWSTREASPKDTKKNNKARHLVVADCEKWMDIAEEKIEKEGKK